MSQHTFSQAFDALLTIQKPKSKNTYGQAVCVVENQLRPWFGGRSLEDFEKNFEEDWAMFRSEMAGKLTRRGKKLRLGHARRYLVMALKRAQNKGMIQKSFSKKDFALNEVSEPIGRALTADEQERLLKALAIHPRTRLQVNMARTMGMRLGEVLKLQVGEVDLEKRVLNLDAARIKTRRARKVPIPISNVVWDELAERVISAKGIFVFSMDRNPNEAQSDNRHWWGKARRAAGVKCRFHDLRHTWATHHISIGTPQDYIVKVGGFTPQVMSNIYSHMQEDSLEKFRSAFDVKEKKNEHRKRTVVLGGNVLGDWSTRVRSRLLSVVNRIAA